MRAKNSLFLTQALGMSGETYRRYWRQIALERREEARRARDARVAAGAAGRS